MKNLFYVSWAAKLSHSITRVSDYTLKIRYVQDNYFFQDFTNLKYIDVDYKIKLNSGFLYLYMYMHLFCVKMEMSQCSHGKQCFYGILMRSCGVLAGDCLRSCGASTARTAISR